MDYGQQSRSWEGWGSHPLSFGETLATAGDEDALSDGLTGLTGLTGVTGVTVDVSGVSSEMRLPSWETAAEYNEFFEFIGAVMQQTRKAMQKTVNIIKNIFKRYEIPPTIAHFLQAAVELLICHRPPLTLALNMVKHILAQPRDAPQPLSLSSILPQMMPQNLPQHQPQPQPQQSFRPRPHPHSHSHSHSHSRPSPPVPPPYPAFHPKPVPNDSVLNPPNHPYSGHHSLSSASHQNQQHQQQHQHHHQNPQAASQGGSLLNPQTGFPHRLNPLTAAHQQQQQFDHHHHHHHPHHQYQQHQPIQQQQQQQQRPSLSNADLFAQPHRIPQQGQQQYHHSQNIYSYQSQSNPHPTSAPQYSRQLQNLHGQPVNPVMSASPVSSGLSASSPPTRSRFGWALEDPDSDLDEVYNPPHSSLFAHQPHRH